MRYHVTAANTATASTNRIHDDDAARQLGFAGGLVPGATVYAYTVRAFLDRWGGDWLERGAADISFVEPAYDGEDLLISTADRDGRRAAYVVTASGRACAAAHGWVPPGAPPPCSEPPPAGSIEERLTVHEACERPGRALGSIRRCADTDAVAAYLASVDEVDDTFARDGLVHPGWLLQCANDLLKAAVDLGPWIHTASRTRSWRAARVGEELEVRGRTTRAWIARGQQHLEIDVLVLDRAGRALHAITHSALVEPATAPGSSESNEGSP